ncbi:MAG: tetratricopeptide repeat protein [Planctomycetes bacterium]|nr:tetratricopeptide repeat protein [Planctomycetota bacterium]
MILPVLAAFDAFANSVMAPFILDDSNAILQNTTIRNLWDIATVLNPPLESTVEGRPVINFTLAVNYAISDLHPLSYHIFNLIVHLSATLALFGIIRRTLLRPVIPEYLRRAAGGLACVAAMLWAVHPIQTQAVTYVIQRCESFMGLMYLLSLYCLIRSADEQGVRPGLWQALAVAVCAVGMASKEVMVTAPVILLLYDRAFLAGSLIEVFRSRWKLYITLAMTWGVLAVALMSSKFHAYQFESPVNPMRYALNEPAVILHYLRLVFWPEGLSLVYYWPESDFTASMLPGILVIGAMIAATLIGLVLNRPWGWLGAWFFGILSVTSSVVPQYDLAFEHRMYLPLAAVTALTVLGVYCIGCLCLGRSPDADRYRRTAGRIAVGAAAAICIILMVLTIRRNHDYHSELSIWSDTVAKQPRSALAGLGLANALIDLGRNLEAVEVLQETLRIKPDYVKGRVCLGCAYLGLGNLTKAMEQFDISIQIAPKYHLGYYNRGLVHMHRKEYRQAVENFQNALSRSPGFEKAVSDLAQAQRLMAEQPAESRPADRQK